MQYKILASDYDNTLVPFGESQPRPAVVKAVKRLQASGGKFVLSTGRAWSAINRKGQLGGIRFDYAITCNGACVVDRNGTIVAEHPMTNEEMYALVDFCEDYNYPLQFNFRDAYYAYCEYETLRSCYAQMNSVGLDCVAALARWRPPLAVFDMGTATTLSVVDREGIFRGGMILPGLRLSVDALSARAAQLPCITFTQPEGLLGTDTVSCMRSGALYGAAAALEGISLRLEEELGPVTVVLTGGHGRDILPLLRRAVEYEPHLQLMGLRELWLRSL